MKAVIIVLLSLVVHEAFTQHSEGLQKINGTELYIETIGEGEPLLIVHGGPGMNHSYFLPHLNTLAKRFKIVFFDQRASGKSAILAADSISLNFFTEDIEALRKYLGVDKLNLFGHSWGVIPVIEYGIRYPSHINRMILCNPVPLNKEFDQQMALNQKRNLTKQDSLDRAAILGSSDFKSSQPEAYKKLLLLSFRHSFYNPANVEQLQYEMPANYMKASQSLFTGLMSDLKEYDYYNTIKQFSFPVLILHGQADAIPLQAVTKIQSAIAHSALEVFQKSGHFLFIEEPKKFKSSIQKFLR